MHSILERTVMWIVNPFTRTHSHSGGDWRIPVAHPAHSVYVVHSSSVDTDALARRRCVQIHWRNGKPTETEKWWERNCFGCVCVCCCWWFSAGAIRAACFCVIAVFSNQPKRQSNTHEMAIVYLPHRLCICLFIWTCLSLSLSFGFTTRRPYIFFSFACFSFAWCAYNSAEASVEIFYFVFSFSYRGKNPSFCRCHRRPAPVIIHTHRHTNRHQDTRTRSKHGSKQS